MRGFVALLLCVVLSVSAQTTPTTPSTGDASPAWEKAVQDATAQLTARDAAVLQLHNQCQAARGVLQTKRTAHEESQQSVVAKKVVVAQSERHQRSATTTHSTAKTTLDAFRNGPFIVAQKAWQAQTALRPELEAKQAKITKARQDLARDFPAEIRANAQRDLDKLQVDVTARVTAHNNAKVAYDAAVLTLNQHTANLKMAQTALDAKNAAVTQARAALAAAIQLQTTRLNERKGARVTYDACVNQLTQAKQAKVAAVGAVRNALATLLQNLQALQLTAQLNEQAKQTSAQAIKATVLQAGSQVKDMNTRIASLRQLHAEANKKLARAIADFTVAQTHAENAKQQTLRAKNRVAKAKSRISQFNAAHATTAAGGAPGATGASGKK